MFVQALAIIGLLITGLSTAFGLIFNIWQLLDAIKFRQDKRKFIIRIAAFTVALTLLLILVGIPFLPKQDSPQKVSANSGTSHTDQTPMAPSKLIPISSATVTPLPSPTATREAIPTTTPVSLPPTQRTLTSQRTQSQSIKATGQSTVPGTHASGIVCIDNFDLVNSITLQAGSIYDNTYSSLNIHMVLDATVTTPPAPSTTVFSQKCIPGHILEIGRIGNNAFNSNMHAIDSGSWSVFNNPPFSNGQDPQNYTAVQQSDIDNAAAPLKIATKQAAIANIQQQTRANEHLISSPTCTYNITSDHQVGDRVITLTVTVQATCAAIASA